MNCSQRTKPSIPKYCEQLDHLSETVQQKRPELANRRSVTFHQHSATHIFAHPRKTIRVFLGCFAASSCYIVLILLHRIIISSIFFKILLVEKISQIRRLSKFTLNSFLWKNLTCSERRGSLICPIVELK